MIIITGSIVARDDSLSELRALCIEHVHRSRREPGCISHDVHIDAEDPLRLVFIERWMDEAAVRAHFAVPASIEFVRAARRLAADLSPIQICDATETNIG
jgi:quinol monooxygenase YgiN